MRKRRVTSADIAKASGVSRSSVSLVLNGRAAGMVDAEKQERIRAVAREMGYVPNASAVNLRRQSTATIGLVTDAIASAPFAGPLLSGASDVAIESGYMILTIDTWQHPAYVDGAMATLRARDVDGLIYADAGLREVALPTVPDDLPIVLANAFTADDSLPAYIPDDEGGGRAAAELVLAAGHRRIAFLTGDPGAPATAWRVQGVSSALTAAGVTVADSIIPARYSVGSNHAAALELLRRPDRPTAILAANDRGAVGVMLAAASLGLSVPGDLSVVGYDDEQVFAAEIPPGITTIALPHREMGRRATTDLLRRIATGDNSGGGTEKLPCLPVVRDTVSSPSS
ncbi:LacI family transcriptional regulator [Kribbella amoyensis]|uniref:LacI family transcriptional regulator n=1 Tax=Kribbella amoyensis TaxID=996641 RepID=A0A561BL81_9ACTN|nr:LacI family DNA-binding transcriptional regulator [Kribbella amoyensis]TWD79609.1 LacI family transcriptional regulator [Kribbella amoyensis]